MEFGLQRSIVNVLGSQISEYQSAKGGICEIQSVQMIQLPFDIGEGEENADEEDCSAEFAPVVQLNEVETVSGEEAENTLVDL